MKRSELGRSITFRALVFIPLFLFLLGFSASVPRQVPALPVFTLVREPAEELPPVILYESDPMVADATLAKAARRNPAPSRPLSALKVPILMYHEIAPGPNSLYVPPAEFAAQLDRLQQLGYTSISMRQLYNHYAYGEPVPPRPIILTFDDGYASFYSAALPLMQERGFTGTLFVITGYVGRRGFMTWEQIRQAAADGTEVAAHTHSHLELPRMSSANARYEAVLSREILERELGGTVRFFAYPAGRHDTRSVEILREAGFLASVTTQYGLASAEQDPLMWQRIRIDQGTSAAGLERMLRQAGAD